MYYPNVIVDYCISLLNVLHAETGRWGQGWGWGGGGVAEQGMVGDMEGGYREG